jgi:DNA adenine methylase
VVYCDPPYENTGKYQKGINHERFYYWCRENKIPVFISSYEMPQDFICVGEYEHISTLSATNNGKKTIEKLYWNGQKL